MKFWNGTLKWLATLLFTLAAGLLSIILLSNRPEISPLFGRLITIGSISLVCALLLRLFFRKGIAFLVVLLAFISATFSTLVIDSFYDTEYTLNFVRIEDWQFSFQSPTIQEIAQLTLLLIISLPFLLLFRKKTLKKKQVVEPRQTPTAPKPSAPSFSDRVRVAAYKINPKNWNLRLPKINTSNRNTVRPAVKSAPSRPKVHVTSSSKSNKSKPKIKAGATQKTRTRSKISLPKFGSKPAENGVNLKGEEEHVCPYCLEEVNKNDSRGIAICKECGTWHHQDCWDVTGACGVAHRNKL